MLVRLSQVLRTLPLESVHTILFLSGESATPSSLISAVSPTFAGLAVVSKFVMSSFIWVVGMMAKFTL
ncbi:Uncharacterised protein [Mycobacteroides abscessus subsp. abscessus]|nr:Uncharacterised protein [Mycobacteroides abscessus subsp. abscessus]